MFSAKSHTLAGIAGAAALSIFGALPGYSATEDGIILAQQQAEPSQENQAPSEETAPAAPETGGAEEGAGDTAAPDHAASPETEAPSDAAPAPAEEQEKAASPENGSTEVAPVTPESAAPETQPGTAEPSNAQSSAVDATQLKIGAAVFGSDGAKIGEINGVKTDTDGKVQEILVTDGVPAGINAKVFAISGDKITDTSDGVKLSLTSEEAKQLPVIDNSDG